ncbi:CIC11C00000003000 [Sungouiella intermedia]|uniref:Mediator of RNA polymerase II transcription subunit 4 n=1 Tax=Sungouiella intermedia TaxID=45354 RepID=A0A1L0BY20_9ASCO|nr:CIC11C00000003000 [[Candida] intermedia]
MLPHKDQSFISVPVSRVGLSTRLNQLNGLNNASRPTSRPGTPSYVTSSLNPTRNLPVSLTNIRSKINTKEDLDRFENLPIVVSLRDFETTFNDLSLLVSSFKEEEIAAKVDSLISISNNISKELDVLKHHQVLGTQIDLLKTQNSTLDTESKHILKELISCRADLKKLPRLPAKSTQKDPIEVSVQGLLNYAMKLAKFSKAPPTVMSQMIHPNNYVWPAEDALRRGMLAMASLKPDELIRAEIGEKSEPEDVEMEDAKEELPHYEERPTKPVENAALAPKEATPAALDLDLFDEDEDSD